MKSKFVDHTRHFYGVKNRFGWVATDMRQKTNVPDGHWHTCHGATTYTPQSKETRRIWAIPTSGLGRDWGCPDPWTPRPAPPLALTLKYLRSTTVVTYYLRVRLRSSNKFRFNSTTSRLRVAKRLFKISVVRHLSFVKFEFFIIRPLTKY